MKINLIGNLGAAHDAYLCISFCSICILLFTMQAKLALKFMFEQKLILNVNSTQTFKMPRRLRPLSLHSSKSKTMSILCILPRRSGLKNSLNTFYWSWKILNTSMPVCKFNYLAYILYISTMA